MLTTRILDAGCRIECFQGNGSLECFENVSEGYPQRRCHSAWRIDTRHRCPSRMQHHLHEHSADLDRWESDLRHSEQTTQSQRPRKAAIRPATLGLVQRTQSHTSVGQYELLV